MHFTKVTNIGHIGLSLTPLMMLHSHSTDIPFRDERSGDGESDEGREFESSILQRLNHSG